ncbi:hypothetical protein KY285_000553 [Solanum tuberosum]|nr:hypothetical protein KY285_000553 [Solanum tuberosum]
MVKKSVSVLVVAILFFTLTDDTLSKYLNSSACVTQNCGDGVNISYPFWIPEKQPSYCGLPAYNVTCNKHKPFVHISEEEFIIKEVYYTNYSILLAKADVFDVENKCPVPRHNFSTRGTPFSLGPNTADLFFYDCTQPYERETYDVNCARNATHHSFAWDGSNCRDCHNSGGRCGAQRRNRIGVKIGIGFGTAAFTALMAGVIFLIYRCRQHRKSYAGSSLITRSILSYPSSMKDPEKANIAMGVHLFDYTELNRCHSRQHTYKRQQLNIKPPRPSSSGKRWRICGLGRRFKPHTMQSEARYLSGEG